MTPRHPPMTLCWCLTTREAAPPPAPSAPFTPHPAVETRTTITSVTGGHVSASWLTCTVEETTSIISSPRLDPALLPLLQVLGVGWVKTDNIESHIGFGSALLYFNGTSLFTWPAASWGQMMMARDHGDSWPSKASHRIGPDLRVSCCAY